ncbi:4-hydroxybutyrate CoA-transferase [Christensenellaceae bacterium OttesenSCG-928-K19]|nr:4-hydroxybutyrate CoA-transferase [Christensenellaceae bacterium OttesenSCG-928-K19]
MADWKEKYKSKLMTAEESVTHIHSGERAVIAHALGAPVLVIEAMVANKEAYRDVEIVHMLTFGGTPYVGEGMEKHFRNNSLFAGATNRNAINEGAADFTPAHFSRIPDLIRTNLKPDVLLCQVSPPDENGYVSLGLTSDYTMPAATVARTIIAEVNPKCPRVFGDTFLHVSQLECMVYTERDIISLPQTELTDVEKAIGKNCAELVQDGDTLQLGIGAIPDSVLFFLRNKKDLGIHSEIVADGVQYLIEHGVINGSKKTQHVGKVVATGIYGTSNFHKFVNNHPMFELYPSDYTNDVRVIASHDNLVSINSCIQVDFAGEISSDTIGTRQYSGIGGQADFVRGANLSKGGRSIMACYSTAKNGTVSRIVPVLTPGAAVATMREDVDYFVTEHGIAHLKGRTLYDRAKQLIGIAHPKFRDELLDQAEKRYNRKVYLQVPELETRAE